MPSRAAPHRQLDRPHRLRKFRPRCPRYTNNCMTTQREMEITYVAQQEIIVALYEIDDPDLATRLERCMTARCERHYGDGWPYSCRTAACLWCRRAMIRGWWAGICDWSEAATASSLAIIPILSPAGLFNAVRWLRRGLRDVRDRTAQRWGQWRTVYFAGLMGGDHRALVMISHQGIDRREGTECSGCRSDRSRSAANDASPSVSLRQ
jgi:hypothetical protein